MGHLRRRILNITHQGAARDEATIYFRASITKTNILLIVYLLKFHKFLTSLNMSASQHFAALAKALYRHETLLSTMNISNLKHDLMCIWYGGMTYKLHISKPIHNFVVVVTLCQTIRRKKREVSRSRR